MVCVIIIFFKYSLINHLFLGKNIDNSNKNAIDTVKNNPTTGIANSDAATVTSTVATTETDSREFVSRDDKTDDYTDTMDFFDSFIKEANGVGTNLRKKLMDDDIKNRIKTHQFVDGDEIQSLTDPLYQPMERKTKLKFDRNNDDDDDISDSETNTNSTKYKETNQLFDNFLQGIDRGIENNEENEPNDVDEEQNATLLEKKPKISSATSKLVRQSQFLRKRELHLKREGDERLSTKLHLVEEDFWYVTLCNPITPLV